MIFIAQMIICGISARKTQLLLELKNNTKIKQWSSQLHTTLASFSLETQKNSTGRSIGSWLRFIAQSIRGFSARKTQLLLEFQNNANFLNSGYRTFTQF